MSVTVTSHPDRDELFAELWYGDEQWGELLADPATGSFRLVVYPPQVGGSYSFDLADVEWILREARRRLEALEYP